MKNRYINKALPLANFKLVILYKACMRIFSILFHHNKLHPDSVFKLSMYLMCSHLCYVSRYILLMYAHIKIIMFHLPIIYQTFRVNFTLHFYHFIQMLKETINTIDANYIVLFYINKTLPSY